MKEKSDDDKFSFEVGWNDVFLRDCVCLVYFDFVEDVKLVIEVFGNLY